MSSTIAAGVIRRMTCRASAVVVAGTTWNSESPRYFWYTSWRSGWSSTTSTGSRVGSGSHSVAGRAASASMTAGL
jgi:hypothetical protein